jgi:predicted nuclease of predicted toxin-antitoxin system
MRFFLDQNVDARVGAMLRAEGHHVWSAHDAGMSDNGDDELTVYAVDRRAVLVTHDREFSRRRRANVIGRRLWLDCPEPDASELLKAHLPNVVGQLRSGSDLFLRLSRAGMDTSRAWG